MKKTQRLLCLIVVGSFIAGLTACSTTPNKAPVIERTITNNKAEVGSPVDASKATGVNQDVGAGMYVVKRGDTLYRIALDHGQSYSDIVAWNNLKNPNDIKVDQILRVSPPDGARVSGAQTSVVTSAAIEVKPLSNSLNNKNAPRGDKRPYSEANLAELQKADGANEGSGVVAQVPSVNASKATGKVPSDSAAVENSGVDWMWPAEGKLVATFDDAKNKGVDISGKMGQEVLAAASGKVMYAGSGIRGYGNLVIIKHTNALLSAYAHNKAILVKEGQTISKGQKIAEMGNSDSDSVRLHFEIRLQGKPVDPMRYLPAH